MSTRGKKRSYEPSEKHKRPLGFGSLCPDEMSAEEAQELLDRAVSMDDLQGNALLAAKGEWLFIARPTRLELGIWHERGMHLTQAGPKCCGHSSKPSDPPTRSRYRVGGVATACCMSR